MIRFRDALYGEIELPDWIRSFIKLPEFVRLRGVRLSNVDSIYFKDFSGPTRWEHGIAAAMLAQRCAIRRGLRDKQRIQLVLAALLHDVGTPPFAHTAESVLANFDHEIEGERLLTARYGDDFAPDAPVFQSQLPQFQRACEHLSKELRISIDPDEIAKYIAGEGDLGFLVNGPIDLDNADNVTRASLFLGLKVCPSIPLGVADWLAYQKQIPTDLDSVTDDAVKQWIGYRNRLYTAFFEADESELGRTAFLQHLMRRGVAAGLRRSQLIWATDEDLMTTISKLDEFQTDEFRPDLSELVQRYRLLDTPTCIVKAPIEDTASLRALRHPDATAWITEHLRSDRFEPMVLVLSRRFSVGRPTTLFPVAVGALFVFHLGSEDRTRELQKQVRDSLKDHAGPTISLPKDLEKLLSVALQTWAKTMPWSESSQGRSRNVKSALESIGDWGFRLSRNDGFHAYPSTFVHALPANLLVSLGIRDNTVLDPFGGTGQTAIEAVKYGNTSISADVNTIACMVAKARLTYIPQGTRDRIKSLDKEMLLSARKAEAPAFESFEDWFHPRTVDELRKIAGFIHDRHDVVLQTFLQACLSAILPSCTARRGEQHGYFADNCPLPSDLEEPPYQTAVQLFLDKTNQAVQRAERLYGFIARQGRSPEVELARAHVRQVDVVKATPESYGVENGEVGAIITSPPYLCMADYALGQRLSYEWLAPSLLNLDYSKEIGARRQRLRKKSDEVIATYFEAMDSFAALASLLVRKGGYVAVVLGSPLAKDFRKANPIGHLDKAMEANGFELTWSTDRHIHWHRNHGYARLKKERVSVHVKR